LFCNTRCTFSLFFTAIHEQMSPRKGQSLVAPNLTYEGALLFWKTVTNIFFREIRPRGAFNIPKDGPVIFVAAPHHNQVSSMSLRKL
jgi:1-acyl-sn-glycerol-3-phosphate acyltransferase